MHMHSISIIALAGIVACFAPMYVANAESGNAASEAKTYFTNDQRSRLAGVWDSTVTVHVCGDSSAELRSFRALNLFEADGSLVATSAVVPSPSLGEWQWLGGRKYRAEFRSLRLDPAGEFVGSQQVTRLIEMGSTRDTFASVVQIEVFGVNDQSLGAPGCAVETARRAF